VSRGGLLSLPASLSLNGAPSAVLECAVNCTAPVGDPKKPSGARFAEEGAIAQ